MLKLLLFIVFPFQFQPDHGEVLAFPGLPISVLEFSPLEGTDGADTDFLVSFSDESNRKIDLAVRAETLQQRKKWLDVLNTHQKRAISSQPVTKERLEEVLGYGRELRGKLVLTPVEQKLLKAVMLVEALSAKHHSSANAASPIPRAGAIPPSPLSGGTSFNLQRHGSFAKSPLGIDIQDEIIRRGSAKSMSALPILSATQQQADSPSESSAASPASSAIGHKPLIGAAGVFEALPQYASVSRQTSMSSVSVLQESASYRNNEPTVQPAIHIAMEESFADFASASGGNSDGHAVWSDTGRLSERAHSSFDTQGDDGPATTLQPPMHLIRPHSGSFTSQQLRVAMRYRDTPSPSASTPYDTPQHVHSPATGRMSPLIVNEAANQTTV